MKRREQLTLRAVLAIVALTLVVGLSVGCARNAPPSLTPEGITIWQANELTVGIGTAQRAAIGLNAIIRCDVAVQPLEEPVCAPLLSDDNTEVVVDAATDAFLTIAKTPEGWKAIGLTFADRVDARLDAAGLSRFKAYVEIVRQLLAAQ